MASPKYNPFDNTWVKINPTGETITECERGKQAVEKQQNADRKAVAARPWRMMCICVTLICVAAFILVNAAWLFSIYFPPYCVTRMWLSSSEHENSSPNTDLAEEYSSSPNADLFEEHFSLDPNKDAGVKQVQTPATQFVQRREWIASPAKSLQGLRLPTTYVIVSQTSTRNCSSLAECCFQVNFLQQFHMENQGRSDIIYNFLVGGDGRVYVGRDWNVVGEHTMGFDARSIGVAFIGTYDKMLPSKAQLNALQVLIEKGLRADNLLLNYKLLAHRQITYDNSTSPNPGNALYDAIKTLPHWSPIP